MRKVANTTSPSNRITPHYPTNLYLRLRNSPRFYGAPHKASRSEEYMLLLGLSPLNSQYTIKLITTYSYGGDVLVCDARSPLCAVLAYKRDLGALLPAPAPWAGSCSLKAAPAPLGAPIRSTRQPVLLADLSTHKPFTSNH